MAKKKEITDVFTLDEVKSIIHNLADYQITDLANQDECTEKEAIEETIEYIDWGMTEEQKKYLKSILK